MITKGEEVNFSGKERTLLFQYGKYLITKTTICTFFGDGSVSRDLSRGDKQ